MPGVLFILYDCGDLVVDWRRVGVIVPGGKCIRDEEGLDGFECAIRRLSVG
jgi:hypothetical protein